jgi:hypothetical protein
VLAIEPMEQLAFFEFIQQTQHHNLHIDCQHRLQTHHKWILDCVRCQIAEKSRKFAHLVELRLVVLLLLQHRRSSLDRVLNDDSTQLQQLLILNTRQVRCQQ